jgi:uncharacterized membrane protein
MSAGSLAGILSVIVVGALCCVSPAMNRPTVQFGVRVPAGRTSAPVIGRQRRAYYARTAAIGVCCAVAALLLRGHGSWWLARIILLAEMAADLACFLIARKNIRDVKNGERWFAGLRQAVVTDTSWRADPPRFPVRWLIPAIAVLVATIVIGVLRYPHLPARLAVGPVGGPVGGTPGGAGRWVPKSVVTAFAVVAGQLYVTVLCTGMMILVYRSRPDLAVADSDAPGTSVSRYRRFLAALAKAMLSLVALVNLSLLLTALRKWQVYQLPGSGSALPLLPYAVGLIVLAVVALRAGQGGYRLRGTGPSQAAGAHGPGQAARTDRDDDRFWKAGLIYVNRDDPALVVGARFGVGWTLNLANPVAWLIVAGTTAVPAGLAVIAATAGM